MSVPITAETFDQAVEQSRREDTFRRTQEIEFAVTEFAALLGVVNQRLGEAAPSMEALRQALDDCLGLARHVLTLKGGPPDGDDSGGKGPGFQDTSPEQGACMFAKQAREVSTDDFRRAVAARNEVYRRLTEAGEELRTLEPHSPVPFLIRKAVAWGNLSFPELIQVMSQEEGLLHLLSKHLEPTAEPGVLQDS